MKRSVVIVVCIAVLLLIAVFGGLLFIRGMRSSAGDAGKMEASDPMSEQQTGSVDSDKHPAEGTSACGWLEIPGTEIAGPIVMLPVDEAFSFERSDGDALYCEAAYNSSDFSDPVTVLYGQNHPDDAVLADLQMYFSDSSSLEDYPVIQVNTPEEELTYGIFACVPFSGDHILANNDFSDVSTYVYYFLDVTHVRELSSRFNEEYAPEPGDRVLILSTGLAGDNERRYLVMAVLL